MAEQSPPSQFRRRSETIGWTTANDSPLGIQHSIFVAVEAHPGGQESRQHEHLPLLRSRAGRQGL